ncbi:MULTISPECIES: ABC transporter permease [Streptomyces]|uniref:ABC transporter permease n=1 Tax=Streptomyces TaxID=1883 RepID=UPI00332F2C2C
MAGTARSPGHRLTRSYTLRRALTGLVQCGVVLVLVYFLTALLPGDSVDAVLSEMTTPEQAALARHELGLDEPVAVRFGDWAVGLLQGDLGHSLVTGLPVTQEIRDRLAATVVLASAALLLVVPLALALGILTGLRENGRLDRAVNAVVVALHAVPEFVLGLLLVAGVSLGAGLLPATAAGLSGAEVLSTPAVLVLPVTVLVCRQLGDLTRQTRIGVAEQHTGPVARHLRLLGLPERTVVLRHVLPGALAPAVQQLARCVDGLLGGAVVVEALFAVGGVGTGFVQAVQDRDLPTVQGYALLFALTAVVVNFLADIVVHRLTPRRGERA